MINKYNEAVELERQAQTLRDSINNTLKQIHKLSSASSKIISDLIYNCNDPDDLAEVLTVLKVDHNKLFMEDGYNNTMSENTDYNLTEWCDVQYTYIQRIKSKIFDDISK